MNRMLLMAVAMTVTGGSAIAQDVIITPVARGRMPIRGAAIIVKVPDYAVARQFVLDSARREVADLLDGRTIVNEKGKKNGWLSFRVSSERAQALLQSVRSVGKLHSESLNTVENVSEYEELERRISRIREHQDRLDGILKSARRLRGSDILYIQERLFRAGVDEGELLQRRVDLERAALTNIINVTLFEPGAPPIPPKQQVNIGAWFGRGMASALLSLQHLFARASTAAAFLLVFAPLWIPSLILAVIIVRRVTPLIRKFHREFTESRNLMRLRRTTDAGA